jgi:hypothetical protein
VCENLDWVGLFASEIFITISTGMFDNLGDPGVDGRIILRWIFWK